MLKSSNFNYKKKKRCVESTRCMERILCKRSFLCGAHSLRITLGSYEWMYIVHIIKVRIIIIYCKIQLILNLKFISRYLRLKSIWDMKLLFSLPKYHFLLLKGVGPHNFWSNGQKTFKVRHIFYPLDHFFSWIHTKKTKTLVSFPPIFEFFCI